MVATGWNPAVDPRHVAVREEAAAAIRRFVLEGRQPRRPGWGERLVIAVTHVFNPTGFTCRAREVRTTALDFVRRVEEPLLDHIRRNPAITEQAVRRLARARCELLKEVHFVVADTPPMVRDADRDKQPRPEAAGDHHP